MKGNEGQDMTGHDRTDSSYTEFWQDLQISGDIRSADSQGTCWACSTVSGENTTHRGRLEVLAMESHVATWRVREPVRTHRFRGKRKSKDNRCKYGSCMILLSQRKDHTTSAKTMHVSSSCLACVLRDAARHANSRIKSAAGRHAPRFSWWILMTYRHIRAGSRWCTLRVISKGSRLLCFKPEDALKHPI